MKTSKPRCEECRRVATTEFTVTHSDTRLGVAVSRYCSDHAPREEETTRLAASWNATITRKEI